MAVTQIVIIQRFSPFLYLHHLCKAHISVFCLLSPVIIYKECIKPLNICCCFIHIEEVIPRLSNKHTRIYRNVLPGNLLHLL